MTRYNIKVYSKTGFRCNSATVIFDISELSLNIKLSVTFKVSNGNSPLTNLCLPDCLLCTLFTLLETVSRFLEHLSLYFH